MKVLAPWSDTDTTELERLLLEAARADQVPPALELKMADALSGLPPTAATVACAGATGAGTVVQPGSLLFSKLGLWGSLSAALLAGFAGWQMYTHSGAAPSKLERSAPPLAVAARAPQAKPVARAGPEPVPVLAVDPTPAAERAALAAPEPVRRAPPRAVQPAHRLGDELALLDRARAALAEQASDRALRLIEEYTRRFAGGVLRPEADVLRIEALVQRGDTERAERLSRRFTRAHPGHLLSSRVQRVAQSNVAMDATR